MSTRVVIVTGGASGVCKSIALRFLHDRLHVPIVDRDREKGPETASRHGFTGELRFLHADVSDEASVRDMVQRVVDLHGCIDVLVNNAGIANHQGSSIESLDLTDWDRMIGNNLTSVFLFVKHAVPSLRAARGAIVNIASTRAIQSEANTEPYSASKGGMIALTHKMIYVEWRCGEGGEPPHLKRSVFDVCFCLPDGAAPMSGDPFDGVEDDLDRFYEQLDAEVQQLTEVLEGRLNCRVGCCACCVEGLTVFEVEAEHIQRYCGALLENGMPHPEGACACLDETGACRIYEHRPYVCRTQGLPLRWIEEDPEGELCEMRDICPVNEVDCDVLELDAGECWTIGPFEERLSHLQMSLKIGSRRRIPIRSLFKQQR